MPERWRIEAAGVLQGIGFRPFVYRLAVELSLVGFVRNDGSGVDIQVEGTPESLRRFVHRLRLELPSGGRIDDLSRRTIPVESTSSFEILRSDASARPMMTLVPDRFVCATCLEEMKDPRDRRYRYPFINCTHCGPRYTIANGLPYDRPMTTMAEFPMCDDCLEEYASPADRRYHAEPVACPRCGPRAWLHLPDTGSDSVPPPSSDPLASSWAIERAARFLSDGRIVAVKGIGGFHLAVDASSKVAVMRLRALKHRKRKPFALMVRDIETADRLIRLTPDISDLLSSPSAPIVVVRRRAGCELIEWVAPGLADIGVMLPYSPLHHQLLELGPPVLVMTSGNPPSEPICIDNKAAQDTLGADVFLMHNRPIAVANDDSVIRAGPFGPIFIRRSRGYVPIPLKVSGLELPSVLALGALLKVTLASLHQGQLVVGRHLGDLDNERAEDAFIEEVERMLTFGRFAPERIALDLHPDLPSSRFAGDRFAGIPMCRVQHHHAHLAAVMVEHALGSSAEVAGIILDGFGYGSDGALWGGEVLTGGYAGFERTAHLRRVPQPGGDRAAVEPGRMATALLVDAGLTKTGHPAFDPQLAEVCRHPHLSPPTSSAGRLFDGVAALLEIAPAVQDFEGEAAALVERHAAPDEDGAYPLPITGTSLDTRVLVQEISSDKAPSANKAARFINGLADGLVEAACATCRDTVVLGGGAMVNRRLVRRLVDRLRKHGKTVLMAKYLPPGDGGLSAGQAVVAAHMSLEGK